MQDDDDEGGRKLTYEFQQQRVCTGNTNILSGLRGDLIGGGTKESIALISVI
jgi:hypothetical protein